MKTTIHCTRCGTVTTWTPYCPGCGAYLEFAGDPPWVPDPRPSDDASSPTTESESDGDASTEPATSATEPSSDAESASGTGAVDETKPDEPSADESAPPAPEISAPAAKAAAKPQHPHRRIGGVAPWWRFWDRPKAPREEAAPIAAPEPEGPREADAIEDTDYTYVVVAPDVPESVPAESPAMQEETQKRTIPIGRPDDLGVTGGIPCPVCRFRNYVDASYCARCGYPLGENVPEVWGPGQAFVASEEPPHRTNWTLVVVIGFGVFLLVAFLVSPPAAPIRSGVANWVRSIAYWIDPALGNPANVASVKASSTGYGNPATSLTDGDASAFWASAPGPSWGAGTTMTFKFTEPVTIDRMLIQPGIQNGQFAVRALATPENLTLILTELDPDPQPSPSPTPTGSSTNSPTGTASGTAASSTTSASGTASASSSDSPSPSSSSSPSPSPGTSASGSPSSTSTSTSSPSTTSTPTSSPSLSPTPTATSSVQASLPTIAEQTDWTSVVTFPAVFTDKVVLRLDTVYPPALPNTYPTNGEGQVAISAVQFLQQWTLAQLVDFDYRDEATPVSTPTPTVSTSQSPSPTTTATTSASPQASPTAGSSPSPGSSASSSPTASSSKSSSPKPSSKKTPSPKPTSTKPTSTGPTSTKSPKPKSTPTSSPTPKPTTSTSPSPKS